MHSDDTTCPHIRGQGLRSRNGENKRALNNKVHLALDGHGMSARVVVTAGTTADFTQAAVVIDGVSAQFLLADRGYGASALEQITNEMS